MSEPIKYDLVTIKDIWDKVPANRINECMKELTTLMVTSKNMAELFRHSAEASFPGVFPEKIFEFPEVTTWIDDGKGEIQSNFGELFGVTVQRGHPEPPEEVPE